LEPFSILAFPTFFRHKLPLYPILRHSKSNFAETETYDPCTLLKLLYVNGSLGSGHTLLDIHH
jgi:hypothetical protein